MREKDIHRIFVVSVTTKGLHACLEIVGGLLLYGVGQTTMARWMRPHAWLAGHFQPSQQHFYAFYLLSHGLLKGGLVVFLLREKLWAYPASMTVFGFFIAYQLYRYSFTHDTALVLLSIFDLIVIYLALHEYRLLRKRLPTH